MDDAKIKEICKIGQGNTTCRYLLSGPRGFECAKKSSLKKIIDARVTAGTFTAQGDNCEGE